MQALIRNKRYCTWPVLVGIVKKNLFGKETTTIFLLFFYPSTIVVVFNWWLFRLDAVKH